MNCSKLTLGVPRAVGIEAVQRGEAAHQEDEDARPRPRARHLGPGRIVASEREAPNMFANLV
jgi:hypothetical protein